MIKKNIVLSVIMGVAITLLLTSTNLAQADPTGDIVFITVVDILVTPEQTVVAVVDDGGLEAFFFLLGDPLFPLGVDIDDDSVRIEMPFGIPIPIQFSVHIDDIDWLDESGQEVPGSIEVVSCEGFVLDFPIGPVSVNWMNDEDGSAIWIFLDPIFPPGFPASIHCIYTVEHLEPEPVMPIPTIDPPSVEVILPRGESTGAITKIIDPDENEFFSANFFDFAPEGDDCEVSGFNDNIEKILDLPGPFVSSEEFIANDDAEPGLYHCTINFRIGYEELFGDGGQIEKIVSQPVWIDIPEPEPEEPRTIGFWKNHQEQTQEHLPKFIGEYEVVTFDDATDVFNVNAKNAHDMLAAQLLAAEINVWNNVSSCQEVDDAIEAAQGTLDVANYAGPGSTDAPKKSDKDEVNAIKDILNQFNNFGCS